MVKPSDPEAPARRDGWLEREGTWGEVTVGSLLAGRNRTDIWEVIDIATPPQIEYGKTLWFKICNRIDGVVHSVPPKGKDEKVTFLFQSDEEAPPPRTLPEDSVAIALLVEKLGAVEIATRDNETGEIWCPNPGFDPRENLDHLRICHGMDISALDALTGDDRARQMVIAHGNGHNPKYPAIGKGGFPHRHVPEEF